MQTPKLKSKNLFTLNRQSNQKSSVYQWSSNQPQVTENSSDNQSQYHDETSHKLTELRLKIRNFQKKQSALQGVISDLENQNQLLNQKFISSESKTKQLIQKLSKQQVYNKQLEYQLHLFEQQFSGQKTNTDSMNRTIAELALTLKQLVQSISQGPVKIYASLERVLSLQLDIDVDDAMKYTKSIQNNKQTQADLKKQIQKLKQEVEYEKNQKKRILPTYNELLNKMRTSCSILKDKVDQIYRKADADKEYYQRLLQQKQQLIQQLQIKNQKLMIYQNSNSRKKPQYQEQNNKVYIGDWKKSRLKKELSQIDKQILDIENNLKQQLKNSRFH